MEFDQARQICLDAFDPDTYYYYASSPHRYDNFIDGEAWVGLMTAAAVIAKDTELVTRGRLFLERLLAVGPDARSFAPFQVTETWVQSDNIKNLWYKPKPQSFAGPCGLIMCDKYGVHIAGSKPQMEMAHKRAKYMRMVGFLFGFLTKWFEWPRQHINSMFLAYLIADKKPPITMRWLAADNPFFMYIYRKRIHTVYPNTRRFVHGETMPRDHVVPLAKRKPSTWIFRAFPHDEYVDLSGNGLVEKSYTPIWQVVGEYLQRSLDQ